MKAGLRIIADFVSPYSVQSIPNAVIDYVDQIAVNDPCDYDGHPDCRRVSLPDFVADPIIAAARLDTSPTRYGRGFVCADGLAYIDGRLDWCLTGD